MHACSVYACPGAALTISGCNDYCEGDQYLRLYDSSDTQVGGWVGASLDGWVDGWVEREGD